MDNAEAMLIRDVMYELAEHVREAHALRADPIEKGRWIGLSRAYTLIDQKVEAFGLDRTDLGLTDGTFRNVPTFP